MAFDPKQNFTGNPFGAADMKRVGSGKKVGKILLIAVVVLFAATIALGAFTTVDEGHVGVRYQFGRIVEDDIPPGLVFKIPYVQQIVKVDVREQTYELITNAYTKDTQTVENLIIKLNYSYDESALSDIIRNVGIQNVESKLIIPQLQSVVKNEIGQYRAEELIQNRAKVQSTIEEKMSESLSQGGILVNNLAIEDIDFEDGFEEAVRAKVVAEQEALKMQNKTKEKEEMARQTVIEAEAEAESQKIQADAQAYAIRTVQQELQNSPEYIELEKVKKWDGKLPQAMGDSINPFINFDQITGQE